MAKPPLAPDMVDEERWGRVPDQLPVAAGSFVSFVALRLALDGVVSLSGSWLVTPSAGLAVPFGAAFGLPAAVGIGVAALAVGTLQAGTAVLATVDALSLFALAVVPAFAWESEIQLRTGTLALTGVAGFAVVTAVGVVGGASVLAWGGELVGQFPFYVTFLDGLVRYLVATATVVPVFLAALVLTGRPTTLSSPTVSHRLGLGFVAVPVFWAALAVVGSVGFGIRERIPRFVFETYGVEFLYRLVHPDVFGRGGRRAQVAFGALMLVAWALTFRRTRLSNAGANAAEPVHDDDAVHSSVDGEKTTVSSRTEEVR